MSDATSPVELAEKLGAHADDADHTALKYDRIQQRSLYDEFRAKAADLRAAASLLRDMSERDRQSAALLKLIHDNLGEYIEREGGKVDVTISLAFEASRPAPPEAK